MRYAVLLMIIPLSVSAAFAEDDRESAFRGKRLAEANCASCHSIAQFDESTLAAAPPLREIGARLSLQRLQEILRGDVFLQHAIMPDFEPDRQQADDLAAHIHSIAGSARLP